MLALFVTFYIKPGDMDEFVPAASGSPTSGASCNSRLEELELEVEELRENLLRLERRFEAFVKQFE